MDADPFSSPLPSIPQGFGDVLNPTQDGLGLLFILVLLALLGFLSVIFRAWQSLSVADKIVLGRLDTRFAKRLLFLGNHDREVRITLVTLRYGLRIVIAVLSAVLTLRLVAYLAWPVWTGWVLAILLPFVILLVVAEFLPKLTVEGRTLQVGRFGANTLYGLYRVFAPVSTRLVARWPVSNPLQFDLNGSNSNGSTDEEHAEDEDFISFEEEQALLNTIVQYAITTVREVMTSRMDLVAIPHTATLDEALLTISESGHSRLPLFEDTLDQIYGIIYVKDLIPILKKGDRSMVPNWKSLVRTPLIVDTETRIDDLLKSFQRRRTHIALVVDEYGGTEGIVTLEDILEEIVGDIRDEYDQHEVPLYRKISTTTYRLDARIALDELAELLSSHLETDWLDRLPSAEHDFETLAGLIFFLRESIPDPGDVMYYDRLQIRVEALENHRIKTVLVTVLPPEKASLLPRIRTATES